MSEETSTPKRRKNVEKRSAAAEMPSGMPHNPEMERAVIASILIEPEYCVGKSVEMLRDEYAFYVPAYRRIYSVVRALFAEANGKPIDLFMISNRLRQNGSLEEIGGDPFLADLQNSIATTANFEAWLSEVNDYYLLRKMIQACTDSVHRCHSLANDFGQTMSPMNTLDTIESEILKVRENAHQQQVLEFKPVLNTAFNEISRRINGEKDPVIKTGFKYIDMKIQGGLKPGEMFVLAARPSIGKTSFALNIVRNVLQDGKKVALFSLEMTEEQIARRLLCNKAQISESSLVPSNHMAKGVISRLTSVVNSIQNWPLFIDPTPSLRVMELRAKAHRLWQEHKIDLIVIDYLQLMRASGNNESRQQEVAEISAGIKGLAKELKIPIVALAQLSRESEKGTTPNAMPKLSHLRESGAIEQDADVVAFLHRNRDDQKKREPGGEKASSGLPATCIIEKNRNGETGFVKLLFFPEFTDFHCVDPYSKDDEPKH